jgi:hypothetical protein
LEGFFYVLFSGSYLSAHTKQNLSIFNSKLGKLLSSPGDKFSAEITKTGRQVVKITTDEIRRSAVRYPNTGTVVETIVHKIK